MIRNLAIGIVVATLIVVGLIWLLRDNGPGDGRWDAGSEMTGTPTGEAEETGVAGSGAAGEAATDVTPEDAPDLDLVLGPPLLEGRVTGEGQGIPGAAVHFFPIAQVEGIFERIEAMAAESSGEIPDIPGIITTLKAELRRFQSSAITVTTDDDGAFALRDAANGGYLVLALAQSWLFRYGDVVSIQEGQVAQLLLELERGAIIGGRVVGPAGEGIAGVRVIAEYRPLGMQGVGTIVRRLLGYVNGEFLKGPFEVVSGEDGGFRIESLPPGVYEITAYDDAGLESTTRGVETGSEGVVVYFGEGSTIEGVFTSLEGFPVPDLGVKLEKVDGGLQLTGPMAMMTSQFTGVIDLVNRYIGDGPRETLSGEDGGFRFEGLGAGKYRLSVEDPGLVSLTRDLQIDWGERLTVGTLEIDRGHVVRGVVFGSDGRPLEGAQVNVSPQEQSPFGMGRTMRDVVTGRTRARSAADGSFVVAGLGKGPFRVSASAQGFASADQSNVEPDGDPLELTLEAGQTITGSVVSAVDGEPIADAMVRVRNARCRTDEEGRFVLTGVVEPRRGGWRGGGPGMAVTTDDGPDPMGSASLVRVQARTRGYAGATVELDYALLPAEVQLELTPIPPIRGVVMLPGGAPATGAVVRLTPDIPEQARAMMGFDTDMILLGVTACDLDGKFSMSRYFGGGDGDLKIVADLPGYARGQSQPFSIGELLQKNPEIQITLVEGATVRGSVSDGSAPIAGAIVRLSRPVEGMGQQLSFFNMIGLPKGGKVVHTDADGEFSYEAVVPGDYTLTAEMVGFTESTPRQFSIAGGQSQEFHFQLEGGRTLSGEVVDDQGVRLSGALVRILRQEESADAEMFQAQLLFGGAYKSALTDAEGKFQIHGLPAARYTVVAQKTGFSQGTLEDVWPTGESFESLTLIPTARLRGFVVDSGNGRPITTFEVLVSPAGAPSGAMAWFQQPESIDDPEGSFVRDGLDAGVYDVEVRAAGFVTVTYQVELQPGLGAEQSFELSRAGRLRGVVVDDLTGEPVAGARVALAKPERESSGASEDDARSLRDFVRSSMMGDAVTTGSDGEFLLPGVPDGPQTVVVDHELYVQGKREGVEVAFGEELSIELRLARGLKISGQVVAPGGEFIAGQFLFVRGDDDQTRGIRKTTQSDDRGRFTIQGLAPGRYRILYPRRGSETLEPLEVDVSESIDDLRVEVPRS